MKQTKLPLLLIFFTVFIDLIGFGIVIPLLPVFAEEYGAQGMAVGLIVMSYSLMQFFFTPLWGRLSDKVGRRPIILCSLVASSLGYFIWGFADSLWMLLLSRLVAGFGNANLAVAQAYIADVTAPEDRAKGMGLVGAAFGLGFVLGPFIGAMCAEHGHHLAGFVAAGFSVFDLLLTFFLLPEPKTRTLAAHERFNPQLAFYWSTLSDKRYRLPLALFFISTFAFANMETTLVLLTEHQYSFSSMQNGLMFAYIGLIMVIIQGGIIGRLSRRFSEKQLVVAGSLLVCLGLFAVPATTSVPILLIALFSLAVGSGLNTPANQSILSKLAPQSDIGGVMGVGQSLSTLGRILGPLVGGATFQYLGMSWPYLIGGAGMILACILAAYLPQYPALAQTIAKAQAEQPTSR